MIVDIVDKYCTDDNNPIKKTYAKKKRKKFSFFSGERGAGDSGGARTRGAGGSIG